MDTTIIYVISIILITGGLVYLAKYLKSQGKISEQDLNMYTQIFCLTTSIIDELNIKQEARFDSIAKLVLDSVNFVKSNYADDDKNVKIEKAYNFAIDLCVQQNLELTDNRKQIIKVLTELSLSKV